MPNGAALAVGGTAQTPMPQGLALRRDATGKIEWVYEYGKKPGRFHDVHALAGGHSLVVGGNDASSKPTSWGWFLRIDAKGQVVKETLHYAGVGGWFAAIAPHDKGKFIIAGAGNLQNHPKGWLIIVDEYGQATTNQFPSPALSWSTSIERTALMDVTWSPSLMTTIAGGRVLQAAQANGQSSWQMVTPAKGGPIDHFFDAGGCCKDWQSPPDHGIYGLWHQPGTDVVVTVGHKRKFGVPVSGTLRVVKLLTGVTKTFHYSKISGLSTARTFRAIAPDKPGTVRVAGSASKHGRVVVIDMNTGKEIDVGTKLASPLGKGGDLHDLKKAIDGAWLQVGDATAGVKSTATWMRRTTLNGDTTCK